MRWYFQKRLKQWISKDCTHEEELVCATTWNSWEKTCRRSHRSHKVMDTTHTIEVNITKGS